ncbi:MAG: hypothetical protein K9G60_06105 [Pseudolabrys sp.]|nr:hypothetical protein [Pseudolabrys sp.]
MTAIEGLMAVQVRVPFRPATRLKVKRTMRLEPVDNAVAPLAMLWHIVYQS